MTWTDPALHVWTTGEVVTAAVMNTYVRLNLLALYDAPWCRAYSTVALSVPNITVTALALNSERQDNGSHHSTSSNTSRVAPIVAKGYVISGTLSFAASAGGDQRTALLRVNGVTVIAQHDERRNSAGGATALTVTTLYRLGVGDYVELCAYQDSGGALNVNASANFSPELAIAGVSNAV